MLRQRTVLICFLTALTACGGSSPTAPSGPSIPNVAGSYNGTATITLPEVGQSQTCPASTSVTQSGASVTMAPMVLGGSCNVSLPLGSVTIATTGAIVTGSGSGTFDEPSCGTYNSQVSGGFSGREFSLSVSATSPTCVDFNFSATLSR